MRTSFLPNYDNTGDLALQNQKTLRRLVGTTGVLLPVLIWGFLFAAHQFHPILPSISHYYFTRSASIFEIVVSLMAVFLLIYKGEELRDYLLSSLAGISALLMLLFPTNNLKDYDIGQYNEVAVTWIRESSFRSGFHYFCAAIFLSSLACMALFLFTKSSLTPAQRGSRKIFRNRLYRVCGGIMLFAMLVAFFGYLHWIPECIYEKYHLTFWMEVISVEAFGLAWMVKGGMMWEDKE